MKNIKRIAPKHNEMLRSSHVQISRNEINDTTGKKRSMVSHREVAALSNFLQLIDNYEP